LALLTLIERQILSRNEAIFALEGAVTELRRHGALVDETRFKLLLNSLASAPGG
jgi:hypothetical protein